jgi:hypothetical protein
MCSDLMNFGSVVPDLSYASFLLLSQRGRDAFNFEPLQVTKGGPPSATKALKELCLILRMASLPIQAKGQSAAYICLILYD